MPMLPLGDFTPDQSQFASGVVQARNTLRTASGYRPLPSAQRISATAIPPLATALTLARNTDDVVVVIAAGGDGNLYRYDRSTRGWLLVTTTAYPAMNWFFVEFGNQLIAANGVSKLQAYDLGTGSHIFADLSASAPQAKFLTLIKDQLFAGSYPDATTGTMQLARVGWSAVDDPTNWTPDLTVLSDFQDNPDCGALTGLVGGSYGVALFEKTVKRITFVGPPVIYQFDPVLSAHGCVAAGSVVAHLNFVFYLSSAGFMMFDGNGATPIGAEQVDRWFFSNVNPSTIDQMRGGVDPVNHVVVWVYPSSGSSYCTDCLIYNYVLQKWSHGDLHVSCLGVVAQPGYTLDELDPFGTVDTLPVSLDDRFWGGDKLLFAGAIDNDGYLCNLNGPPAQAVFDTREVLIGGPRRAMLQAFYPLVEGDGSMVSAQVFSRGRNSSTWKTSPVLVENFEGWIGARTEGRFHRIRIFIDGYWTHAVGLEYVSAPMGYR